MSIESKSSQPTIHTNSNLGFLFLILYTIALFIRPQEWNPGLINYPVARYFLIISFIFFLVFQKPKFWGHQGWFLFGIMLVIALSGLRNGSLSGGITQAQDFFIYGLLPFLLYSGLVNTQGKHHWIYNILAIACCIMLHHGLSQKASPDGIGWSGEVLSQGTRITYLGFLNDPNDLGMFFVMNIPILIYLKQVTHSKLLKFLYLAISIGLIYGIFLTNSRGALVGTLSLALTYFYFQYGKIKFFFITAISLPLAFFIMKKFRTIDSEEESAHNRIDAWFEGIQMFKYRPLVGVGKGQFVELNGLTAHNSYVLIMAELGTIGFILWFMTIGFSILMLLRIFKLNEKEVYANTEIIKNEILEAKCLFYSLIGFLTTAFFLSRTYVIFLYMFIGLICAVFTQASQNNPKINDIFTKKNLIRLLILSIISLIVLYFIIIILL
jgi:F0F1-type ATP synthase membrane subunit c/vacuolar-type H+-ATPase subunit K